MKTIYKYSLQVVDEQIIKMPVNCCILCVQPQFDKPYIWALIDTENDMQDYTFYTVGTGHPADDIIQNGYVGTYQLYKGGFVGHVFQKPTFLTTKTDN